MSRMSSLVLAAAVGAFAGYAATHVDNFTQTAKDAAAAMKARNEAARTQFLHKVQTCKNPEVISILNRSGLGANFTMEQFVRIPVSMQVAIVCLVLGKDASETFKAEHDKSAN